MRAEEKNSPVMENGSLKKRVLLGCCLACGIFYISPWRVLAQTETGGTSISSPAEHAGQKDPAAGDSVSPQLPRLPAFVYQREGRPDPFLPFLSQEILKAGAKPGSEPLGIQKLEPGQLNLVAIILGEREAVAMVQDAAGMGYVIRNGTQIGRSGTVKEILPNKVRIEQVEQTPTSSVTRMVEMLLKEGDKE